MILNFVLLLLSIILLYFALTGAPYLPTSAVAVDEMVKLARVTPETKMADIGSGDGRIVIAFARAGAEAHGYEINPLLVWISRRKIRRAGLERRCVIHFQSFWGADFSRYTVVTVFGIKNIMARLERKLRREMRPSRRVLSYIYPFPTLALAEKGKYISAYSIS